MNNMSRIKQEKAAWEEKVVDPVINRFPERNSGFETRSGIPIERVYVPAEGNGAYQEQLGFPGQYPFTRGVQPTMYRGAFLDNAPVCRFWYGR